MKKNIIMKAVFATALIVSTSAAYAAAPIAVTVKHVGSSSSEPAKLSLIGSNEKRTYSLSSPAPAMQLLPSGSDRFNVVDWSPSTSTVVLKYDMGGKSCSFNASYIAGFGTFPYSQPAKTTHKATPSGGATCTSKITSINMATGDMSVEFTMR